MGQRPGEFWGSSGDHLGIIWGTFGDHLEFIRGSFGDDLAIIPMDFPTEFVTKTCFPFHKQIDQRLKKNRLFPTKYQKLAFDQPLNR